MTDKVIDNSTAQKILNKYHNEVVVFGWYSLIKSIFHDDILPRFLNANKSIFIAYPQILRNLFMLLLPVTSPETRPIVIIDKQRVIPQVTKILQSIITLSNSDELTSIFDMDDDNNESKKNQAIDYAEYIKNPVKYLYEWFKQKEDTETVKEIANKELYASRLQYQVKRYYEYVIDEIKGKEGRIRSELIGKSIDFSARNVITPSLEIKPYEVLISYHTARKVLLPEFINFVYALFRRIHLNEKPNEFNPNLYKSDFKIYDNPEQNKKLKEAFKIFTSQGL